MLELSDEQRDVMDAKGHLLVLGGPGSGKTTVAILKAGQLVAKRQHSAQKVIFLSFARSTVARIVEALAQSDEVGEEEKRLIDIETYHAFFWRLLRAHGYLLGLPRTLSLLAPPAEAVALAHIRKDYPVSAKLGDAQRAEKAARERVELGRLAQEEGKVCFGLFSTFTGQIMHGSRRIRSLIGEAYPAIILDEFQDTNDEQWAVVRALGKESDLIALADPEQRIYEFIGADPERINQYRASFRPAEFSLGNCNYRSGDTQILSFGNDVLRGRVRHEPYKGISVVEFAANHNQAYATLKGQVLKARARLIASGKNDWSLAILVPTKKMTRTVSEYLDSNNASMPAIQHRALIDVEAVLLAAEVMGFLMQPKAPAGDFLTLVRLIRNFFEGRGGDSPSKGDLDESARIGAAFRKVERAGVEGERIPRNSLILRTMRSYEEARRVGFTGDPDQDWLSVRAVLDKGPCKRLRRVASEVRGLRLLNRGTQLRAALLDAWQVSLSYGDALDAVRRAFVQDHFASAGRPEMGITVMNMHKAKGKQFDEVIIFEGWPRYANQQIVSNPDRIVRENIERRDLSQERQNFRVSITRAKSRTTILTPQGDRCVLLWA